MRWGQLGDGHISARDPILTDHFWLLDWGIPFREAHAIIGALVRACIDDGADLASLVAADERLGPDAAALLAPGMSVRQRTTPGSAGPAAVSVQRSRLADAIARRRETWA